MQFSIDDLPAPLGPMMARISPLAMSKLISLSAFTPPNDRLMFSTTSRMSLKTRERFIGPRASRPPHERAGRPRSGRGRASARLPERHRRAGARMRGKVADLDVACDGALAAVLEGDANLDMGAPGTVVERLDQGPVALADEAAPHLVGARELAVVGVERLVQDEEAADLRARHAWIGG